MLPSDQRLRSNKDFRCVYARSKSHVHPLAVIYVMRRTGGSAEPIANRVGFVVSKKQGCAVIRNRIKRRLREAVRERWHELDGKPHDIIFVGRKRLYSAGSQEVTDAVDELLKRSGLLKSAFAVNEAAVVNR